MLAPLRIERIDLHDRRIASEPLREPLILALDTASLLTTMVSVLLIVSGRAEPFRPGPKHLFLIIVIAFHVAVFAVLLFAAPPLIFTRRLIDAHHRGVLSYGGFALRAAQQFDLKWLAGRGLDEQTLEDRDFAATNGLFSIARNAIKMRPLPFEARSIAVLGGAALLPFVPAELLRVPFDVILQKVGGFFL